MTQAHLTRLEQLKHALGAGLITQHTFDAAIAAMSAQLSGSGVIAQGQGTIAVAEQGLVIRGDNPGDVNTGKQLTAAKVRKSSTPKTAPPSSLAMRRSR